MLLFEILAAKYHSLTKEEDQTATEIIKYAGMLPEDVIDRLKGR